MAARQQQHQHDDDDDEFDDGDGDGDDGETGRIRSLDALADALERLEAKVERAFTGGRARNSQPASSGSSRMTLADSADERRREIREELAALRAQEKADAERGDLLTRLGKVEKIMEQPPRQLRKIEERMGWHRA